MFNIFEHPYLMIAIAAGLFLAHRIIRAFIPEKMSNRYLLAPLFIVLLGLAVDFFVRTDNEKINTIIKKTQKAVAAKDMHTIGTFLSDDYKDSYHPTAKAATDHLKSVLNYAPVERLQIIEKHLEIQKTTAAIKVKAILIFKSEAALPPMSTLFTVDFEKQPDKSWLVNSCELIEIGKQSMGFDKI